jgi:hypothetical protein
MPMCPLPCWHLFECSLPLLACLPVFVLISCVLVSVYGRCPLARFLFSPEVYYNTVFNSGYSGFSVGWGWGSEFPQGVGNITLSYNKCGVCFV